MMSCEQIRTLLGAHLDGELDAVNDRALQDHLRDCPACLRAAELQENLRRIVRQGATYHRAPAGLEARVRAALRGQPAAAAELPSSPGARARPERASRWAALSWQWAGAAATVAA